MPPPIIDESGEGEEEEVILCGFDEDGNVDYSESGANWCGLCRNGEHQSPISTPVYVQAPPLEVDSLISFGDLRHARVDTSKNWVELYFYSDGMLRLEGTRNETDFQKKYRPTGYARFHTPAEHAFSNMVPYDVELEIFFEGHRSNDTAIVSIFWDRSRGGVTHSKFIDSLELEEETSSAELNITL